MPKIDRRAFLSRSRDLAFFALLPGPVFAEISAARPPAGEAGVFLNTGQLRTLRSLCHYFIPGPPDDPDPGALEAGVPEYIDLLLGAFETKPLRIYAGGPFSNRNGGGHNSFADFLELDAIEELAWRTRIEGSRGLPEREWNGPVKGLQEQYVEGLLALDQYTRRFTGHAFHELSRGPVAALLVAAPEEIEVFLTLAFQHCAEGMYGAPEYGGNRERVGWTYTRWPGDPQPIPYTPDEISKPDADEGASVARSRANAARYARRPPDPAKRA